MLHNIERWKIDTEEEFIYFLKNFHRDRIFDFFNSIEEKQQFIEDHKNNNFLKENLLNYVFYKTRSFKLELTRNNFIDCYSFFYDLFSKKELLELDRYLYKSNPNITLNLRYEFDEYYTYLLKRDSIIKVKTKEEQKELDDFFNLSKKEYINELIGSNNFEYAFSLSEDREDFLKIIKEISKLKSIDAFEEKLIDAFEDSIISLSNNFYYNFYLREEEFSKSIIKIIDENTNANEEYLNLYYKTMFGIKLDSFNIFLNKSQESLLLLMRNNIHLTNEIYQNDSKIRIVETQMNRYGDYIFSKDVSEYIFRYSKMNIYDKMKLNWITNHNLKDMSLKRDFHYCIRNQSIEDYIFFINFSINNEINEKLIKLLNKQNILYYMADSSNNLIIDDRLLLNYIDNLDNSDSITFLLNYKNRIDFNASFISDNEIFLNKIIDVIRNFPSMSNQNKKEIEENDFLNIINNFDLDILFKNKLNDIFFKSLQTIKNANLSLNHFGKYISQDILCILDKDKLQKEIESKKIQSLMLQESNKEDAYYDNEYFINEVMFVILVSKHIPDINHLLEYNRFLSLNKNLTKENLIYLYLKSNDKDFFYYNVIEDNLSNIKDIIYFCTFVNRFEKINFYFSKNKELEDFNNKIIEYKYIKNTEVIKHIRNFLIKNDSNVKINSSDIKILIDNNTISEEIFKLNKGIDLNYTFIEEFEF